MRVSDIRRLVVNVLSRRKGADVDRQAVLSAAIDSDYYTASASGGLGGLSPGDHYERFGWRSGLDPAPWFSTSKYLKHNQDVSDASINPFLHYLEFGKGEGRASYPAIEEEQLIGGLVAEQRSEEPEEKSYEGTVLAAINSAMDHRFYRIQLSPEEQKVPSLAQHYLEKGWMEGLDPSPDFSTEGYLSEHSDVKSNGMNPFAHYLLTGHLEGRVTVRSDRAKLPGHIYSDGKMEWSGYHYVKAMASEPRERGVDLSLIDFATALAGTDLRASLGRFRSVELPNKPVFSVIIPCLGQDVLTTECLNSVFVADHKLGQVEVIVADNNSAEDIFSEMGEHDWIKHVRFEKNIGFGPACNAAASQALGEYLLFLNNDAQVSPDFFKIVAAAFEGKPRIGIVGPRLMNFDGTLQEAGAMLDPGGWGNLIGYGLDPTTPRFNYSREVEYVSGAALVVRREVFERLNGFDDAFAPAYCEDVDLCFRARQIGYSSYYEPKAIAVHHLSKTTSSTSGDQSAKQALIDRNRAKLIQRWSDDVADVGIRTIAFYLPQYHPIAQNDLWWGKGFTEWSNVSKAAPNFLGHRQPRRPADLGYYDLRVPEIMDDQAALASRYKIDGFCYYYYWFGGDRVLEMPLDRLLKTGKPDFPFCICWANENWTRRWDGADDHILLKQEYDDDQAVRFARDVTPFFTQGRYIRVNGRPLFLVYRLQEIPNPKRFLETCRNVWRSGGIGEVNVAMVESFALSAKPENPARFGANLTVEFPAHGMVRDPPMPVTKLNPKWTGSAHDYRELAINFMTRPEAGFTRLRSVLTGWDSTARHPDKSFVLQNATPGAFQAWLEWTYTRTREQNFGDERIVFLNAWNEWSEGAYLEPDTDYGHGFLEAVRNAREAVNMGGQVFEE